MDTALQVLSVVTTFIGISSLKGALLAIAILAIQRVANRHLTASVRYLLWFPVVIALIVPVGFDLPLPAYFLPEPPTQALDAADLVATGASAQQSAPASSPIEVDLPQLAAATSPVQSTIVRPDFQIPWLFVVQWMWLAGVIAVLGAVVIACHRFSRLVLRATPAADNLRELLQSCMTQVTCQARIQLLHSTDIQVPMIAGLLHPVLLLPAGLDKQVSREQLRQIFLHELMHFQRGDIVSNWVVTLAQALHWFNPMIWLAFFCMRQDRELACDAATLRHLHPSERATYGHTLLQLNDSFSHKPVPAIALGMLDSSTHLQRRIRMLVQTSRYKKLQSLFSALLLLPFAAAALSQPVPEVAPAPPAPAAPVAAEVPVATAALANPISAPTLPAAEPLAPSTPTPIPAEPELPAVEALPAPAAAPQATAAEELKTATTADAAIVVAAVATEQPVASADEPQVSMDDIQQLAREIAAAKPEKLYRIEEWNRVAADCEKNGDRLFGSISTPCRIIRMALARGEVLQFGFECFTLNSRQAELSTRYQNSFNGQLSVDMDAALRRNEKILASFCDKATYAAQYPAFAAMFADAEALKYYNPARKPPSRASWYYINEIRQHGVTTLTYENAAGNDGWGVRSGPVESNNFGSSGFIAMPAEPAPVAAPQ